MVVSLFLYVGNNEACAQIDLDEVILTNDPCDPDSYAYDYCECYGCDSGDPCDPDSLAYDECECSGCDSEDPCDPTSISYNECECNPNNCEDDECDPLSSSYLGDCECLGVGCGDISIGGGNQQYGNPYVAQTNDKLAKTNIPTTMPPQSLSTCVSSVFEYMTDVCGDNIPRKEFEQYYFDTYTINLIFVGVNYSHMNNFASHFFDTSNYVGVTQAIDAGNFVMTNIDGGNGDYHNVLIIGYHPNGDYIYMEPMVGSFREGPPSNFPKNYAITIENCK